MATLHDDEIPIDTDLVRRLVDRQFPAYASLDLHRLQASGSSNALFRLGADKLVRLPRQPGGSATIDKEARWLPLIAPALTTRVPRVLAVGEPDHGYPERWSVTTWIDGHPPAVVNGATSASTGRLADDLAELLVQLRELPVPPQAHDDPALRWYRGGPLTAVDQDFRAAVRDCRRIDGLDLDLDAASHLWDDALAASQSTRRNTSWYHGDLLAENLLVQGHDRLAAVLDFGGLAVGDPAVDLIPAWEVLDRDGRARFRRSTGVDDATWLTGVGWVLLIAVMTFPYYGDTMPARCASRRAMLANVLAET